MISSFHTLLVDFSSRVVYNIGNNKYEVKSMEFDNRFIVKFKYAVGQEVTFYCNGKGAARGNIVEQMSYLNKENKTAIGYAIKSVGEIYYHIPEKNVFPKSVTPEIVLKIMRYESVSKEYNRNIEKGKLLKNQLDTLLMEIPEDILKERRLSNVYIND